MIFDSDEEIDQQEEEQENGYFYAKDLIFYEANLHLK